MDFADVMLVVYFCSVDWVWYVLHRHIHLCCTKPTEKRVPGSCEAKGKHAKKIGSTTKLLA